MKKSITKKQFFVYSVMFSAIRGMYETLNKLENELHSLLDMQGENSCVYHAGYTGEYSFREALKRDGILIKTKVKK